MGSAPHPPEGQAGSERIAVLDALRGTALLGVLLVNLLTDFRAPMLAWLTEFHTHGGALNHAVDWLIGLAIESKAYATFAFLFGLGVAIQAEGGHTTWFFVRRFGVLFGLGLTHMLLFFVGDILTLYALLGACLIPLRKLRPTTLLVLAGASFEIFTLQPWAPWHTSVEWPTLPERSLIVRQAMAVYPHGSFMEIARFRWVELRAYVLPLLIGSFPRTLGMSLLGMTAWKAGWLCGDKDAPKALRWAVPLLLTAGGAATAWDAYCASTGRDLGGAVWLVSLLGTVPLALGYMALVLWVLPRVPRVVAPLAAVGRMTLTNYLVQSLAFGLVFYGYGLGQFGRWGPAPVFAAGLMFYGLQILFSVAWLRRYARGPAEALWRWLGKLYSR